MSKQFTSLKEVESMARDDATFFTKLLGAAAKGPGDVQEVVMAWFGQPLHDHDAQKVVDTLTDAKWSAFHGALDAELMAYFW